MRHLKRIALFGIMLAAAFAACQSDPVTQPPSAHTQVGLVAAQSGTRSVFKIQLKSGTVYPLTMFSRYYGDLIEITRGGFCDNATHGFDTLGLRVPSQARSYSFCWDDVANDNTTSNAIYVDQHRITIWLNGHTADLHHAYDVLFLADTDATVKISGRLGCIRA